MAVFLVADVMVPGLRKRRYSQEMVSGMLMKQEQCVVVLLFLFFFSSPEALKVAGLAKPLVTNKIPAPCAIVWPCCRMSCSGHMAAGLRLPFAHSTSTQPAVSSLPALLLLQRKGEGVICLKVMLVCIYWKQ